jgi:hypothetical protein
MARQQAEAVADEVLRRKRAAADKARVEEMADGLLDDLDPAEQRDEVRR